MADQYTKAEWAAIQAGRAMAAAYQPGFNAAFPPRPVTTQPAGKRGDVGAPGQRGAPGATVYAATPTPVGSRTPVYTRGARTTEEQLAMVQSGNPAAMSLQQYGRAASNLAKSRSQMKDRGDTTFYSGYGEDRFRLSNAIRAPDATGFVSDGGTDAPDANFDRMAPYLAKDTAGRELAADYGVMVKGEKERLAAARSSLDISQFSSVDEARAALTKDAPMAVRGFSSRASSAMLTDKDREAIQANAFAKQMTAEAAKTAPPGSKSPVYKAGPDGKVIIANAQELGEDAKNRAKDEVTRMAAAAGGTVYAESTAGGDVSYKVKWPSAEAGDTQSQRFAEANRRIINGDTFEASDAAPATRVWEDSGPMAERLGIKGEKGDGKVSVERSTVDASLMASIAQGAYNAMQRGFEGSNTGAIEYAIGLEADRLGISKETLAQRLGSTPNAFEDSLYELNNQLYGLLDETSSQRVVEARDAAQQQIGDIKAHLTGPVSAEFVQSRIGGLQQQKVLGNPGAGNALDAMYKTDSVQELAGMMANSFRAMGAGDGRFASERTGAIVSELEAIARGDTNADPELTQAVAEARMRYTKWGEEQVALIKERASSSPVTYQLVSDGKLVYNADAKAFMAPEVAGLYGGMTAEDQKVFLDLVPRDAARGIVGFRPSSGGPVGYTGTEIAWNQRETVAVAAALSDLGSLVGAAFTDVDGVRKPLGYTERTVMNIMSWAVPAGAGGGKDGVDDMIGGSTAPASVKQQIVADKKLEQLWNTGDVKKQYAALAVATVRAQRSIQSQAVTAVTMGIDGVTEAMWRAGVLSEGQVNVVHSLKDRAGAYSAGAALDAQAFIMGELSNIMASSFDEQREKIGNEWDYEFALTSLAGDVFQLGPGDPEWVAGGHLEQAKKFNDQLRNELGTNAYGIPDQDADALFNFKDEFEKQLDIKGLRMRREEDFGRQRNPITYT